MSEPLPQFKYHPDPLATEAVVVSEAQCICCEKRRGFIYTGPVYSPERYDDCFCPWCIAEGSAHEKYGVYFNTAYSFKSVAREVVDEILYRTPGFPCWEQGDWQEHCQEASLYIGIPGKDDIENLPPRVLGQIREGTGVDDDELWAEILDIAGDRTGIYRIYLFRCLKCGEFHGFVACE
jgi:uncharacterized protein